MKNCRMGKNVLIEIDGLYKQLDVEEYVLGVMAVFAKGAVEAAKFLHGKGAGHYDMADVIAAK